MAEAEALGDLGKAQKTTRAARGESVTVGIARTGPGPTATAVGPVD